MDYTKINTKIGKIAKTLDPHNQSQTRNTDLTTMKKQADLLKVELRVAIGKWVKSGHTTASFNQMIDAFDAWKLARWQYDRAFDRSLDLSSEWR